MNNRVRHLDLRLSLPPELRAQSWQIAERLRDGFVSAVVERIAERLHARFGPDAIIEIPMLEVRWDGRECLIQDFDYATQMGDQVADDLLGDIDSGAIDDIDVEPAGGRPRVYRNQAHRSAIAICTLARHRSRSATLANQARLEHEWQRVCEQGSATLADTVSYICDFEAAATVIEALSRSLLEAAVMVLPLSRWAPPARRVVAERLLQASPRAGDEPPAQTGDRSDATARPARSPRVPAALDDPEPDPAAPDTSGSPGPADQAEPADTATPGQAPARRAADTSRSDDAKPDPGQPGLVDPVAPPRAAGQAEPAASKHQTQPHRPPQETLPPDESAQALPMLHIGHAGLVYLLNLTLRIELPEILWCCGIDERSFLFDLCCRLTARGDETIDPVVTCLSGVRADKSNYRAVAVPDWAWAEVLNKVHARLQPRVTGVHYRSDDDVIATMIGTHDPEASWPALVACAADLLASAFLDLVNAPQGATIDGYLRLPGELRSDDEQATITLPMEAIDIDVRRAALDVNPGYLAWTGLTCRLVFSPDDDSP